MQVAEKQEKLTDKATTAATSAAKTAPKQASKTAQSPVKGAKSLLPDDIAFQPEKVRSAPKTAVVTVHEHASQLVALLHFVQSLGRASCSADVHGRVLD